MKSGLGRGDCVKRLIRASRPWQGIGAGLAVVDVGWCNRDLFDERRVGVGADTRLETMDR